MDRVTATARLTYMVAASSRPVLDTTALGLLIDGAQGQDPAGLWPTDPGYVLTWDLNVAALEGWRWKAAQVAGDFTFSADDATYDKGAVLANIERMIATYAAKCHGSATVVGRQESRMYDYTALIP